MREIEIANDCVMCPDYCRHCGRDKDYKIVHLTCDKCGEEFHTLYEYDGQELCEDCLLEEFELITEGDVLNE